MGQPAGLAPEQLRALDRLRGATGEGFYLAGGSAVAFHLGHRTSHDLDLFALEEGASFDAFYSAAREDDAIEVIAGGDTTMQLRVEGVPIDVVRYPYPPLDPPTAGPGGFPVAGLRDLAVMKLAAVARRGLRRDFWDLMVIVEAGLTLDQLAADYLERFGRSQPDLYHVWKSLTYFDDAEKDPVLPRGMDESLWQRIKSFWEENARAVVGHDEEE